MVGCPFTSMMAFCLHVSQCGGRKKAWGAVLPCTLRVRSLGFQCTLRNRCPLTTDPNLTHLAPFRGKNRVLMTCSSVLGPLSPLDASKVVVGVLKIILWMGIPTTNDPQGPHGIHRRARVPLGGNATHRPKAKDPWAVHATLLLRTKDPWGVNATLLLDFNPGGV